MDRRQFIISSSTVLVATTLSGCSKTNEVPKIKTYSFEKSMAEAKEDPEVSQNGNRISISGSIQVKNGCMELKFAEPQIDTDASTVNISVKSEHNGADMCTQAIRTIGYKVDIEFEDKLPETVNITHTAMEEETFSLKIN